MDTIAGGFIVVRVAAPRASVRTCSTSRPDRTRGDPGARAVGRAHRHGAQEPRTGLRARSDGPAGPVPPPARSAGRTLGEDGTATLGAVDPQSLGLDAALPATELDEALTAWLASASTVHLVRGFPASLTAPADPDADSPRGSATGSSA